MIRRLVPWLVLPLALLCVGFSVSPWLRIFPTATLAVSLFGAVLLSVLVPLVVHRLLPLPLPLSALLDLLVFLAYSLLLVLKDPLDFSALGDGFVHAPSQILTFALPLVSPPALLVPPVALCWLVGAVTGEALARQPGSLLPHVGFVVSFGLAYAATQRAVVSDTSEARWVAVFLAAGLLLSMSLLRTVQAWIRRNVGTDATQGEGAIPLRPVALGAALVTLATIAAALTARSAAVSGTPAAPAREPSVRQTQPVTPLAFVSALRPAPDSSDKTTLFNVSVDRPISGYIALANVDYYDGDSWSFSRTFRPSGGVIPADLDSSLASSEHDVTQHYRVVADSVIGGPWMPYVARPVSVDNIAINVDSVSGMIVPATTLVKDVEYSVTSAAPEKTIDQLAPTSPIALGGAPIDTQLPSAIRQTLSKIVSSFGVETNTQPTAGLAYLQALAADLRTNYSLAGGPVPVTSATPSGAGVTTPSHTRTGGTNFSDVVASIIGPQRSGTPEQYATLIALVARQIGIPARVVSGFKIAAGPGAVKAGTYQVADADATTWVEIPVRETGWVVVDGTPSSYSTKARDERVGASSPAPKPTPAPARAQLQAGTNGGHAIADKSDVPTAPNRSHAAYYLWGLLAALIVSVLIVFWLLQRKRSRRRRRMRTDGPRERLIAAWAQSLDSLTEAGIPDDLRPFTSSEVRDTVVVHFGPEAGQIATGLALSADEAMYYPAATMTMQRADEAWAAQEVLEKVVSRQLSTFGRIRAAFRYSDVTRAQRWRPGPESWRDKDES